MHLKGQLHIHTTCSDGRLSVPEVVKIYQRLDYDFIAISDHDHLLKPNYRELMEAVQTPMLIFYGIELTVSTRWGYVHVNQIEGEKDTLYTFNHPGDYDLTLRQTQQCIEDVAKKYPIDAVEVTHHGFYTPQYDIPEIPFPKLATDDSHTEMGCGRAWIEMDCPLEKDSIIKQIRAGFFQCCYAKTHTTPAIRIA